MTDHIIRSLLICQSSQYFSRLANTNLFSCSNHHSSQIPTIREIIDRYISLVLRLTTSLIFKMRSGNGSTTQKMFVYPVPHSTKDPHKMMKKTMVKILTTGAQSMNTMTSKT